MHRHAVTRFAKTSLAVAVAAVSLAACQSVDQSAIEAQAYTDDTLNDPIEPVGPGSAMTVEGFEWGFDIVEGVAVDGEVEVTFENTGGTVHNFRIDNAAGENKKVEAPPGESDTGVLKLFAGEYTYYCDIPGHRSQGMVGDLVVYASPEEAAQADPDATETATEEGTESDTGPGTDAGGGTETETPAPTEGGTGTETESTDA